MTNNQKIESLLFKVNKVHLVVADTISEAESVFKKHFPQLSVEELKKVGKILM